MMKILEDCARPFLCFRNSQKVSSNIAVMIENMKNEVPCVMCKRYPSQMIGTTSLCKRRVALDLWLNERIDLCDQSCCSKRFICKLMFVSGYRPPRVVVVGSWDSVPCRYNFKRAIEAN